MAEEEAGMEQEDGTFTRRRFVQVCVGVAAAAAVGATASSFLGLRSPLELAAPPEGVEAVAVCPICSVGCGLISTTTAGEAHPSKGDPRSTSTSGMVCTRGSLPPGTAWPSTLSAPMRRLNPTTKGTRPTMDQFQTMTWEKAIERITAAIVETETLWGPDARGCIMGADVAMEDAYIAGKLWKAVLRSPNTDSVESMHSRATDQAYMAHLGEVAPPTCFDDVNLANMIVVVGEDLANTHPVLYAKVVEAVTERGAHLMVIDPRRTATAIRTRSDHVPVKAGGEVALLNSVGYVLVHEKGVAPDAWAVENALNATSYAEFLKLYNPVYDPNERVDAGHLKDLCNGPSEWVDTLGNRDASGFLKSFNVASITGLTPEQIRAMADRWAISRNVLTIWSSRLAGAGEEVEP